MLLATHERFLGTWYTHYRHHTGFAKRAQLFVKAAEPILVVGCGFGYLVDELLQLSKPAQGIDASSYCCERRAGDYVERGDILSEIDVVLLQAHKFGTVITEDLLPCLTDEEAQVAAKHCAQLGDKVVHLVTEQGEVVELNYHSLAEWTALTGQLTLSLEGM